MRQRVHVLCAVLLAAFLSGAAVGEELTGSGEPVLINIYDHMAGPTKGEATPDWGYSAFILIIGIPSSVPRQLSLDRIEG
jgi:hypothetical protein